MNIDETTKVVVELAREAKLVKDIAFMGLLKASGYFELYEKITEDKIWGQLTQNPGLVQDWIDWSDEKRSSEAWYFKRSDDGIYVLRFIHFEDDVNKSYQIEYSDPIDGCASFVKRSLEQLRLAVLARKQKRQNKIEKNKARYDSRRK